MSDRPPAHWTPRDPRFALDGPCRACATGHKRPCFGSGHVVIDGQRVHLSCPCCGHGPQPAAPRTMTADEAAEMVAANADVTVKIQEGVA